MFNGLSGSEISTLYYRVGMFAWIIATIIMIIMIASRWIIFAKAGEKGWKSLVPFYSGYIFYKIVWGNGWLFLLNLLAGIPIVGSILVLVITGATNFTLAKRFGYGTLGRILCIIFPTIFYLVIALGNSEYTDPPRK